MEPIFHLQKEFWDYASLKEEASVLKQEALVFETSKAVIRAVPMSSRSPALKKLYVKFLEKYPYNFGQISMSYMYINKGEVYPYHVDNVASTAVSNLKPVQCTINILVSGEDNEVEFEGLGKYKYKACVFNTSHMHRITPQSDRTIVRISFRESSYEDVVRKIQDTINT